MRVVGGLFAGFVFLGLGAAARAAEGVPVCFNYGCSSEAVVLFAESRLFEIGRQLRQARTAVGERERLAVVIGQLYAWAGEQAPVGTDRAGNVADGGVYGAMDCIDHATTTTRFLRLLERRGALHFHHVREPARRGWIFQHYTAVIEENLPSVMLQADALSARWAVDSWYVDNGQPALVLPLKEWFDYWSPDA